MTTKPIPVSGILISDPELDPITVFWQDFEPGRGAVTITCWGNAWTCYFGAMGMTIGEFVAMADIGYLISKLARYQNLKDRKREEKCLTRIVVAIKASLAKGMAA